MIQKTINENAPGLENQKKIDEKIAFLAHFLDEIKEYDMIYCLISGGYHSTSTALLLNDYGFKNVSLVHNRTYLESKFALNLIQDVIYKTNYSYNLIEPDLRGKRIGDILKESLNQVDKIIECFKNDLQNYRAFIPCCKILKKKPSRKWFTKNIDKKNSIVISSLCPFESTNRNYRLKQLREEKTYIRLHNRMGKVWYAYPWRDMWSDRSFHNYLLTKGIMPEHSGCIMCPIQIAYRKWKKDRKNTLSSKNKGGN